MPVAAVNLAMIALVATTRSGSVSVVQTVMVLPFVASAAGLELVAQPARTRDESATTTTPHRTGECIFILLIGLPSSVLSRLGFKQTIWEYTNQCVLSLIHISEPTRLGMISYAVFCLKKK